MKMYHESELPSDRYHHTIPWSPDEYMRLGDRQLVYTKTYGDYFVHFPGGYSELLSFLQRRGVAITMPRTIRVEARHTP